GDQRHVPEDIRVAREIDREAVFELDHHPAGFTAVHDLRAIRDPTRVLGVDEGDLDPPDIDRAALVAADQGLALDAFGSQPARDLEVADDFGLGRFGNLERVVDVVEVAVRDEHEIALVDLLQGFGRHRVAHDPGVDDDVLLLGAPDLPGAVPDPREADMSV